MQEKQSNKEAEIEISPDAKLNGESEDPVESKENTIVTSKTKSSDNVNNTSTKDVELIDVYKGQAILLKKSSSIRLRRNNTLTEHSHGTTCCPNHFYKGEYYFKRCKEEDYEIDFLNEKDEGKTNQRVDIIINNIKPWENIDKTKVEEKDCSGFGGSRTYSLFIDDENVEEKYRHLIFHQRKLEEKDPLCEERLQDAQKAYCDSGVGMPRLIYGKNWYVEPYVEDNKKKEQPNMAKVLAKAHRNSPIEWFEKYRQRFIEEFPVLKDAPLGSHVWLFVTRIEWYDEFKEHHKFWQEAGFEPLSEAGKSIVCVHGDLHRGNIIYDKNDKIYFIDYEFTAPQWAVNDIAYIFSINQFGCFNYEGKFKFCKMYLEELGLPFNQEEVDLLIFDAECHGLRCFWPAKILDEMNKTKVDPSYDYKLYRMYEKSEAIIRNDKSLITKCVQTSFYKFAEEINAELKEINYQERFKQREDNIAQQIAYKREEMTVEEEEEMNRKAFDLGVVRIQLDELIQFFSHAEKAANELAGGLCTGQELKDAGLKAPDTSEIWAWCYYDDKKTPDVFQIGKKYIDRYLFHIDKFGPCGWLENFEYFGHFRQYDHVYAKRCPNKNPNYIPMDTTKESEILANFETRNMQEAKKNYDQSLKFQIISKREKMTCEEEEQMLKKAFEKGIVRIPTTEILIWSKADKIAKEFAGGLCTREEFINAGLKTVDGVDFWAYALHTDGGADVIQFGTSPHKRYISHRDEHGAAGWLEKIRDQERWRQLDHVFAKKDEKKNSTYIPKDFTKENEICSQQKAK